MMLILGLALGVVAGRWLLPGGKSGVTDNKLVERTAPVSALGGDDSLGEGGADQKAEEKAKGEREEKVEEWLAILSSGVNYEGQAKVWSEVSELGVEGAAGLLETMMSAPIGQSEYSLLEIIGEYIGRADPEFAFEIAADSKRFRRRGFPTWGLLGGAAETLTRDDPDNALRLISELKNQNTRLPAMYRSLNVLVRTSPEIFEQWLADPKRRAMCAKGHSWALRSAVEQWVARDPARAARAVVALPAGELREEAFDDLAEAYARDDMVGAVAWAQGLGDLKQGREAFMEIVTEMASSDREGALELAEQQSDLALMRNMKARVVGAWALDDATASFGWLMTQDEGTQQRALDDWVSAAMSSGNEPASVIAMLESGVTGERRLEMIGRAVGSWAQLDSAALKSWMGTIEEPALLEKAREAFFGRMRSSEPQWLAEHIVEVRESDPTAYAAQIGSLASRLAEYDPAGAMEWVQSVGDDGAAAIPQVIDEWAERDPAAAAAFAENAEPGPRQGDMAAKVVQEWARSDPEAAETWVGSLEGVARAAASGALIERFARDGNVERAATMFEEELAGANDSVVGAHFESAAGTMIPQLAERDRPRALAILDDIEDPGVRTRATRQMVGSWLRDDPAAASEWVGGLEPGRARDAGVGGIVNRSISENDGEAAFAWSATMTESERIETMERSLRAWAREDGEAAAAGLENAAVSDDERARLENALR